MNHFFVMNFEEEFFLKTHFVAGRAQNDTLTARRLWALASFSTFLPHSKDAPVRLDCNYIGMCVEKVVCCCGAVWPSDKLATCQGCRLVFDPQAAGIDSSVSFQPECWSSVDRK